MDKRYQVFVSSTYTDLREERQAVIQTLMKMDCIPSGMELFPAADEEQWEFIKKVIDDCDYYLLIIGGRYGSVTPEGLSYTEKEFNYAVERGIRIIAFVHGKPDEIPSGKSETSVKLRKRLKAFRDKVTKNRMVNFWTETNQLAGIVALSLIQTMKTHPATGWVRADQIASKDLLNEVNELRKNKERLELEISELRSQLRNSVFTTQEENEFNFIYAKLKGLREAKCHVKIPILNSNEKTEYKDAGGLVKYSLIKVLRYNILVPSKRYRRDFLHSVEEEAPSSESFIKYIKKGYKFGTFHEDEGLQPFLATLGLMTPNFITEAGYSSISHTVFTYSEKLFKVISWLEHYNKIDAEPKVELIRLIDSAH